MTPREFLDHYGAAVVRSVTVGVTPTQIADRNADRYAMWVFGPTAAVSVQPAGGGAGATASIVLAIGDEFLITHHEHLQIVNLAWQAFVGVGTSEIFVIEAFMPPANLPRRR